MIVYNQYGSIKHQQHTSIKGLTNPRELTWSALVHWSFRLQLWHIASRELHDIALPRLLIIDEGVPRGTAIDNGHVQGQHLRQGAWRGSILLKWSYPNSWMVSWNPIKITILYLKYMIWGYHHFRTPIDTFMYWPETAWKKPDEATDINWFTQFHQALRGFHHNFSMDTWDRPDLQATPWQTRCCCWTFFTFSTSQRTPKECHLLSSKQVEGFFSKWAGKLFVANPKPQHWIQNPEVGTSMAPRANLPYPQFIKSNLI